MPDTLLIPADRMQATFTTILLHLGFSGERANECAAVFTENSVDGIYTHGINRFSRFVQAIRRQHIAMGAIPTLVSRFGSLEQWHGNWAPGPLNALFATDRAMELATVSGIGCVALAHTNHWMRGGTYGWRAAKKGFVFICWTNTIGIMPAWGATDARLGNNPLVFALPYGQEAIVLDMAVSQYSYGAMELARQQGKDLTVPGGYDAKGLLTNDPSAILQSRRPLPIGYWKGAGLSLLLDLLAAVLSGGLSTHQITQNGVEHCSQVFIAINISRLSNSSLIFQTVESILADYKESVPENEMAAITYPGEKVLATRSLNMQKGIPVLKSVWDEVLAL